MATQSFQTLFENAKLISGDGSVLTTADLEGKVVGLYFSAHWCAPCRQFTPLLAEKYRELVAAGAGFEIVFISSDRDQTAFDEHFSVSGSHCTSWK
jgi:nucleoredoxin